jgi:hypothetical protein
VAPGQGRRAGYRAREKQLLKEFGGRPGLTEADRDATRNKLKQLIKQGKERGFLTYAEINDQLPEDVIDAGARSSRSSAPSTTWASRSYDRSARCRATADQPEHAGGLHRRR